MTTACRSSTSPTPASPSPVAAVTDGAGGYTELDGSNGIATHTIGSSHYALVASYTDDGVQIIDITTPASPSAVAAVTDGVGGFNVLKGASGIATHTIGSSHYALVASFFDDGVQIIDITTPASPSPAAAVTDGVGGFNVLDGAIGITTHTVGSSHYALVASYNDDGVQIIDITDPENPSAVAAVTDGVGGYTELDGAWDITTHTVGSSHYALVAATNDDGVQIINITNPASPSPVAAVTDGSDYPELDGARSITTHTIGSRHYALVAAKNDDGVQVIDITDPASPSPVADVTDGTDYPELDGANGIVTHTIGSRHYALVAAQIDDGVQIIEMLTNIPPAFVYDEVTFTVEENATSGTVGTVSAIDSADDTLTYSVGGTDETAFNSDFSLDSATGEITVKPTATIDFDTKPSYSVTITATDTFGGKGTIEARIDVELPSRIVNLVAVPGNGMVMLEWDDPSDATINRYQYRYMSTADSDWNPDWTDLPGSGATTTSTTLTDLTNGIEYTFQVRSVIREGGSDEFGTEAEVKSVPRESLVAPRELTAISADDGQIALSWDDPMDVTISGYQYRYMSTADSDWNPDWTDLPGSGATTTSHILSGLMNNVLYTVELRAMRDGVSGPESRVTQTPRGPLAALANFTAESGENQQVTLSWDASADDSITEYQYRYRVNVQGAEWNPDWTVIPSSSWTTASYTISNLANATEYTFEVRSMRDTVEGPVSTANATPEGPPTVPLPPTGLTVHPGDGNLVAEWKPPVGEDTRAPVTGYRVRYRQDGSSSWRSVSQSDPSLRVQTIGGLRNGQTYEVGVASVNSVGTGLYAPSKSATPKASQSSRTPPGPDGSKAIDVGALAVYWLDSSGRKGHPQAKGNQLTLESCSGTLPYFVFFIADKDGNDLADADVDEWQAHITPGEGVVRHSHRFGTSAVAREYIGMHGTVTMSGEMYLSVRVRARVGGTWGSWSPTSGLLCAEE